MSDVIAREDSRETAPAVPAFDINPVNVDWQAERAEIRAPEPSHANMHACTLECAENGMDQILAMLELERQRIAMDLHDGLGPLITLIRLELHNARSLMGKESGGRDSSLAAIQRAEESVVLAFDELRRTVLDLRPAMLDDLGIVSALRWLVRQFELSGTDVNIQSKISADDAAIPHHLKIVIFRICQEMLNNAIKHARASHVRVGLDVAGATLRLSVEDDGGGLALAEDILTRSAGGLPGIGRRAKSSNGKVSIDSAGGCGTRITICWQLEPREAESHGVPFVNCGPMVSVTSH